MKKDFLDLQTFITGVLFGSIISLVDRPWFAVRAVTAGEQNTWEGTGYRKQSRRHIWFMTNKNVGKVIGW